MINGVVAPYSFDGSTPSVADTSGGGPMSSVELGPELAGGSTGGVSPSVLSGSDSGAVSSVGSGGGSSLIYGNFHALAF